MKKFVSMAMVAAMTVSMVPATAFAGDDMHGTARVVNVWKVRDTEVKVTDEKPNANAIKDGGVKDNAPELQIKLTDVSAQGSGAATSAEFTVTLDGAEFKAADEAIIEAKGVVKDSSGEAKGTISDAKVVDTDELKVTVALDDDAVFANGDVISIDLVSYLEKVKDAYVSVESDDFTISNDGEDMIYVDIADEGITATVKKLATVAEEEVTTLKKDLKIKSNVGKFVDGQIIELKLSNGFEFAEDLVATHGTGYIVIGSCKGETTAKIEVDGNVDEIIINEKDMKIEAVSAKEGAIATLTVKATAKDADGDKVSGAFTANTKVEVVEVTDYKVVMSVDEDEVVPEFYSGVDVDNTGLTDDADHISLEVKIKETFAGAWSMHKDFTLELPDGVYVTDVKVADENTTLAEDNEALKALFGDAYQEADHKAFKFKKRTFEETKPEANDGKEHEMTFELELVADPGFVGDVDLKLTGDALDEQEVTIARFVSPYAVVAEQNDLKIDYRYTEVPSTVVIKETEPGLWAKDAWFVLEMEHADSNFFEFEDATVTVDEASGMKIKDKVTESTGTITVTVEEESDEAATITISDMELFMSRSIPAGPYDLDATTSMGVEYMNEELFAPDDYKAADHDGWELKVDGEEIPGYVHDCDECEKEYFVGCVADFSSTVKEAFVNIVTAGREQDDASFTTKVVVNVGKPYIVAGEHQVSLDVPAYVSEAGYTMLPVRAVATALGISNNNVIWNGETKTVTILYGQRIITMAAGEKAVHVNGSVIPASAAVEIVDGRTFLPMRDLATALGVTDITWDAATKTATLNGNA